MWGFLGIQMKLSNCQKSRLHIYIYIYIYLQLHGTESRYTIVKCRVHFKLTLGITHAVACSYKDPFHGVIILWIVNTPVLSNLLHFTNVNTASNQWYVINTSGCNKKIHESIMHCNLISVHVQWLQGLL